MNANIETRGLLDRRVATRAIAAATLITGGLVSPPSSASLLLALEAPAMVERADTIAVVDVLATHAAWDDAHERILSTIELALVEVWKGPLAPAARVTVVQPGGVVGEVTMAISGMPQFHPGERALVFLHGPPRRSAVVGMTQGKRLVALDPASGRWIVAPPARAGALFLSSGAGASTGTPPPGLETRVRPLDDVRDELRALVQKGSAR